MKNLIVQSFIAIASLFIVPAHADQLIDDLTNLSSVEMAGRAPGSEGHAKARDYIIGRLRSMNIAPCEQDYIQTLTTLNAKQESRTVFNILACLPGQKNSEGHVLPPLVISAHYDHLGVKNNHIYFGADDNASGVAAVLHIAAALHAKYNDQKENIRPIVFAFFDHEETGHLGSRAFVQKAIEDGTKLAFNINLDMVGRGDKGELYVAGTSYKPSLKAVIESVETPAEVTLKFGHDTPEWKADDWTTQSDHYAFHLKGIPFLYFGVEDHPDYHQPTDTADKINPQFYRAAVGLIQSVVELVLLKVL